MAVLYAYIYGGPERRVLLSHFTELETKVQSQLVSRSVWFPKLLSFHSASGRRKGPGKRPGKPRVGLPGEASSIPGPAQAPPHQGDRGGPCLPAQSEMGLRD